MERGKQPENADFSIVRRLGTTPQQRGSTSDMNCPDVFALSDGRIGYIGTDVTDALRNALPDGASIGAHERLIALPPEAVLDSMSDIESHYGRRNRFLRRLPPFNRPVADFGQAPPRQTRGK